MQNIDVISFPHDGQAWRLDWFGDVFYQRERRWNHPFIRVALSKVSLNSAGTWLYSDGNLDSIEQLEASVPIGTLCGLRIGTIWRDGKLVADPGYTNDAFSLNTISNANKPIKAGVEIEENRFILPFEAHPYHRLHTHSYCLQVSLDEDTRLIIPAVELIRFYFGSSAIFLNRLFQGPFREDRLWTRAEIQKSGSAEIELASGIAGSSASDIARIAFDSMALFSINLMFSSVIARTEPGKRSYPKMVFPFSGNTRLKVKGVWLTGVSPKTYLAFRLVSCTHPFPFQTLRYTMAKRQHPKEGADSTGTRGGNPNLASRSRTRGNKALLRNEAPDSQKAVKNKPFLARSQFPDLDYKSVSRTDPMTQVQVIIREAAEVAAGASVGEGAGNTGIRPVDLVAAKDAPIPKGHPLEGTAFATYVEGVVRKLLKNGHEVRFVPLDSRQRFPQFSVMPRIVNESDGVIHPLSHVEKEGKLRAAYVSVLRVINAWTMMNEIWVVPELMVEQGSDPNDQLELIIPVELGEMVNSDWVGNRIAKWRRI